MTYPIRQRPIEVLLVEDNQADIRMLQEGLKAMTVPVHLSIVQDGSEALAFLRQQGAYTQAVRPDLVLLDLNLPGKSGLEVLREMSTEPTLRRIPSIVLTSSQAEDDIRRSYEFCANCYVVKPIAFDAFEQILVKLQDFWFSAATLPSFSRTD